MSSDWPHHNAGTISRVLRFKADCGAICMMSLSRVRSARLMKVGGWEERVGRTLGRDFSIWTSAKPRLDRTKSFCCQERVMPRPQPTFISISQYINEYTTSSHCFLGVLVTCQWKKGEKERMYMCVCLYICVYICVYICGCVGR